MTAAVIETDGHAVVLDLSSGARLCGKSIAGLGVEALSALIDQHMAEAGARFAYGRWREPRQLYNNDDFASDGGEMRTVHMGIGVFCAAGTPVHAPVDGIVQHAANNDRELDYGPMLIVRHGEHGDEFFTLYGHLSLDTLDRVAVGQAVVAGEQIASVGEPPGNGNWPPHLHFQQINDLLGLGVDFPGVAPKSEQEYWLDLSPSPARFFPGCKARLLEYA